MEKTPRMLLKEISLKQPLEKVIGEAIEEGLTWAEIGKCLSVSTLTARNWAARLGVEIETKRTARFTGVGE